VENDKEITKMTETTLNEQTDAYCVRSSLLYGTYMWREYNVWWFENYTYIVEPIAGKNKLMKKVRCWMYGMLSILQSHAFFLTFIMLFVQIS